jgi:hypothetical protein
MDIYYQQKYLKYKYKYKYNMFGGAWKAKSEERKREKDKQKADREKIQKVLTAWEQITKTCQFIAKVEMLVTQEDKNVDEAVEIVKTQIKDNETIKNEFYSITYIQDAMDYLELKPQTESSISCSTDNDNYDDNDDFI